MNNSRQTALIRFARLSGWWNLNREDEAALIGLPEAAMPLKLATLTPAIQQRIEALVTVWMASRQAEEGRDWLRRASNRYGGHTPLSVLTEGKDAIDAVLGALQLGPAKEK